MITEAPTIEIARSYRDAGLSIIPIKTDGSKAPALNRWEPYQRELVSDVNLKTWFGNGTPRGIAIVYGKVSGNAECIDFDEVELFEPFVAEVNRLAPGLIERLTKVSTPRPGCHLVYRCEVVEGNLKLAKGIRDGKLKTIIETKGTGGYALAPGCPAECHETGRTYQHAGGPPLTQLPTITPEERAILLTVARSLNEIVEEEPTPSQRNESSGLSPGDDYNRRATWAEILEPHGWVATHTSGKLTYWRRPGKQVGWSATSGNVTKNGNEVFCCFSDNAHPFQGQNGIKACSSYTKFSAFTHLHHGGDYSAAAKDLAGKGYGEKREPRQKKKKRANLPDGSEFYPCTDLGNAERLRDGYGHVIKYVGTWQKFLAWDGTRWKLDSVKQVERWAKKTVRKIRHEAAKAAQENLPDVDAEELWGWAKASEGRQKILNMIALLASETGIAIDHTALDSDPWKLNCSNGTVNLKTGELVPHNPDDLITKSTGVEYPTEAGDDPLLWLETLHTIFEGNAELLAFVHKLFGLSLIGEVYEHILPIFWGVGANGKSVVIETIMAAMGDYAMKAPSGMLLAKRNESHPTEIADLHGRRLVAVVESGEGRRLDEALVKELTGGDTLRARRMREDFWEFPPSHLPIMVTNHKPIVRGVDHGIWRRLRLVPFTVTIPEEKQDKKLKEKLREELPQILRWAVSGCLLWQREGLTPPASVLAATDEYRSDNDTIGLWLEERCECDPSYETKASDLWRSFKNWLEDNDERKVGSKTFYQRMGERFAVRRSNGMRYEGVQLRPLGTA